MKIGEIEYLRKKLEEVKSRIKKEKKEKEEEKIEEAPEEAEKKNEKKKKKEILEVSFPKEISSEGKEKAFELLLSEIKQSKSLKNFEKFLREALKLGLIKKASKQETKIIEKRIKDLVEKIKSSKDKEKKEKYQRAFYGLTRKVIFFKGDLYLRNDFEVFPKPKPKSKKISSEAEKSQKIISALKGLKKQFSKKFLEENNKEKEIIKLIKESDSISLNTFLSQPSLGRKVAIVGQAEIRKRKIEGGVLLKWVWEKQKGKVIEVVRVIGEWQKFLKEGQKFLASKPPLILERFFNSKKRKSFKKTNR